LSFDVTQTGVQTSKITLHPDQPKLPGEPAKTVSQPAVIFANWAEMVHQLKLPEPVKAG
jgi:hypothetical protein